MFRCRLRASSQGLKCRNGWTRRGGSLAVSGVSQGATFRRCQIEPRGSWARCAGCTAATVPAVTHHCTNPAHTAASQPPTASNPTSDQKPWFGSSLSPQRPAAVLGSRYARTTEEAQQVGHVEQCTRRLEPCSCSQPTVCCRVAQGATINR